MRERGYNTRRGCNENSLKDAVDFALGGLDVQGAHVLPVLLQQRNKEIHGNVDVLDLHRKRYEKAQGRR